MFDEKLNTKYFFILNLTQPTTLVDILFQVSLSPLPKGVLTWRVVFTKDVYSVISFI